MSISLLSDSLFRHYNRMILRRRGQTGGTIRSHLIYAAETWEPDHRSEKVIYARQLMIKIHFS